MNKQYAIIVVYKNIMLGVLCGPLTYKEAMRKLIPANTPFVSYHIVDMINEEFV